MLLILALFDMEWAGRGFQTKNWWARDPITEECMWLSIQEVEFVTNDWLTQRDSSWYKRTQYRNREINVTSLSLLRKKVYLHINQPFNSSHTFFVSTSQIINPSEIQKPLLWGKLQRKENPVYITTKIPTLKHSFNHLNHREPFPSNPLCHQHPLQSFHQPTTTSLSR